MARCGDLDSVKLKVQRYLIPNTDVDGTVDVAVAERWFLKLLDEEPTADVAPKSEVARDVLEEIEKEMLARIPVEILKPIRADLDFEDGVRLGKRDAIHEVLNFIGRLKKKYGVWQ